MRVNSIIFKLSKQNYTIIPCDIDQFYYLEKINICNNKKLTKIPKEICNLVNLKIFVLLNIDILEFPEKLYNLTNVIIDYY